MKGLEIERTLLKKDPSESVFYKSIRREGCEFDIVNSDIPLLMSKMTLKMRINFEKHTSRNDHNLINIKTGHYFISSLCSEMLRKRKLTLPSCERRTKS